MAKFIVSKNKIKEQWNDVQNISDEIYYSYKTNCFVGNLIQELIPNSKFSIHNINNIKKIKNKKNITFFLQGEFEAEIEKILDLGITQIVVDNEIDLNRLLSTLTKKNIQLNKLFIRLKFKEHTFYTGKHFVYGFEWKKGIEIISNLESKFAKEIGIHFHRKTQNVGEWMILKELDEIFKTNNKAREKIKYVDIGGGLPWIYVNSKPPLKNIMNKIKELKEYLNKNNIKLIIEPGRYICAPSIRLETEVKNVYDNTIIIDCSVFNAYMDTFLLNIRLRVLNETKTGYKYLIKGNSPDSLDILRYKVFFKKPIVPGDRLVFLDAGAYNFHTEFGNFNKLSYQIVNHF